MGELSITDPAEVAEVHIGGVLVEIWAEEGKLVLDVLGFTRATPGFFDTRNGGIYVEFRVNGQNVIRSRGRGR